MEALEAKPKQTRVTRVKRVNRVVTTRSVRRSRRASRSRSKGRQIRRKKQVRRNRRRRQNRIDTSATPVTAGMVALSNEEQISPDMFRQLPATLSFALAALRPGEFPTPFLDSNGNTTQIGTGVAKGNITKTSTVVAQSTKPYTLVTCSSSLANTYVANSSGFGFDLFASEATTFSNSDFSGMQASRSDVWGTTSSFTDKWFIYGTTMRIVIRTPLVNLAGTAWVGRISMQQMLATCTIGDLKRHAIEIDLKTNPVIELRSFINYRELHNEAQGTSSASNNSDEFVSYVLYNPSPVVSVTTQTPGDIILDVSMKCSYMWWPDFATPALEGVLRDNSSTVIAPTVAQSEVAEAMDRLFGAPIPPSFASYNALINWCLHLANARGSRKAIANTNGAGGGMSTSTAMVPYTGPSGLHASLQGWSDFTSWGSNVISSFKNEVFPNFVDWLKGTALTMGRELATNAVSALFKAETGSVLPTDRSDDYAFVNWQYQKTQRVIHTDDYSPELLIAYESLLEAYENLLDEYEAEMARRQQAKVIMLEYDRTSDRRGISRWVNSEGKEVDIRSEIAKRLPKTVDSISVIPSEPDRSRSKPLSRKHML